MLSAGECLCVQAADEDDKAGEDEENERYDYRYMMRRDKRRWAKADRDSDGLLTKEEFADFLHPEEVDHMKDVVVDVSIVPGCHFILGMKHIAHYLVLCITQLDFTRIINQ